MSRTINEARRRNICKMVHRFGSVRVADLQEKLAVSDMTIRRDLKALSANGLIRRVYGGAVMVEPVELELSFLSREVENRAAKTAIARQAVKLLKGNESLFLDGGTTCYEVAKRLGNDLKLTVVTNSLAVVRELRNRPSIKVIVVGGQLEEDGNTFGGVLATENARKLTVEYGFFSAAGFNGESISNPGMIGTEVKKLMIEKAYQRILLADSSKYGRLGLVELCRWENVNVFITDSLLPPAVQETMRVLGVKVIPVPIKHEAVA